MQKIKILSTILCFSTMVILSSCKEDAPNAAMPQRGPVGVETITVEIQPVKIETELPGRTNAFRVAEVRPQVNGIIKERIFTEGSEVKASELLYQIDDATYNANFDSTKAALARAEAIEHSARLKAERYSTLVQTKAVSELDQIENEAIWKQAIADVAAAKAALNSAGINLNYTKITAPISGVIGRSLITEGALVTAQQSSALAKIQQLDPLYIDVTQSSTEMLRLKKQFADKQPIGQDKKKPDVTIILEDGTEYDPKGSLAFSDVTVDQSTGTVTLRAIIANPDRKLLPGMFVRARLSNRIQEAILIPSGSVSRTQKGEPVVMLVDSESKVEARVIKTGQNIGANTLVLNGLSGGEQLITAGVQNIKAGMIVKISGRQTTSKDSKLAQQAKKGE